MKQKWDFLYESMLQDLELCRFKKLDFKTEIECCFQISRNYWSEVEREIGDYHFLSRKDEIEFYKEVKPLFKSSIEYYNFLYQAELFKPADEPGEMKAFWLREEQRLKKFILEHRVIYNYFKSGATDCDEEYFLMLDSLGGNEKSKYPDDLIALFLALEKYSRYSQFELSPLILKR
jgi:hypothetical protein